MITKSYLVNRANRGKNRDGGGKIRKPQKGLWACSAIKGICPQLPHPRIGCAVHGSKEDAERCIKRSQRILEEQKEIHNTQ